MSIFLQIELILTIVNFTTSSFLLIIEININTKILEYFSWVTTKSLKKDQTKKTKREHLTKIHTFLQFLSNCS